MEAAPHTLALRTSNFLQFTQLSRALSALLVIGYTTQLVLPSTRQYLALVPGRFIPCIWNVITAGFLELSLLKVPSGPLQVLAAGHHAPAVLIGVETVAAAIGRGGRLVARKGA